MKYETRTVSVIVVPVGDPIFGEMATKITIVDEAGGEYVEVSQSGRADLGKIAVCQAEWPAIREAIDRMMAECRTSNGNQ